MPPPAWSDLSPKEQQVLGQIVRGAVPIATVATLDRLSGMGLTERKGSRDEATRLGRELVRRHLDGDAA